MSNAKLRTRLPLAGSPEFSRDEMLEVLNNRRRRFTIHYLKRRGGDPVSVSDLADRVASWENDKTVDALTHKERKRVRNALRQYHLPKMDEYGFIEYDSIRGEVRLTEAAATANFYVDSLTDGGIPWGVYYIVFSALSVVGLGLLWIHLYPFTLLSPLLYGVFFVTALCISSLAHFYDNYYRMRLGAGQQPSEVGDE